ncbi:MAG: N-acetylmuramoyl-L-alanine amidase [Hyphomicrobiaceae bacterium]
MRSVEFPFAGCGRFAGEFFVLVSLTLALPAAAIAQTVAPSTTGVPVHKITTQTVAIAPVATLSPMPVAAPKPTVAAAPAAAIPDSVKGDTTRTRFVIGLEKSTEFQVFSLSNPNRVIVDMPDVRMQLPAPSPTGAVGLVKSFYGGLSAPGKTRVVIAVTAPVVVEKAAVEKGRDGKSHRLILDIVPVDPTIRAQPRKPLKSTVAMASLGAVGVQPPANAQSGALMQPPLPKPAVRPEVKAQKAFKPVIVIDPGHGGHDSGASKFGTIEKDVVLAFSKALRDKLVATGRYKVLMTRETDVFVELDARRDFGEQHNAGLFIAVHADYAGAQARGATIYSLREGVAKDLKRSAKGEVSANVLSASELAAVKKHDGDASAVKNILADFAEREVEVNKDRTSVFARSVIDYMGGSTSLQNNPDRSANFRVLKTAKVPAVLIELAYVTNRQDAANLKSDEWRNKVSGSITTAVENYFSNQIARLPM